MAHYMDLDDGGGRVARRVVKYPTNSHASKQKEERPKLQPVVNTPARTKRKSLGRQISESFVVNDFKSVFSTIVFEVLIPSAKSTFIEMAEGGLYQLFGMKTPRPPSNVRSLAPSRGSFVNYDTFSRMSGSREPENLSYRARATHDFDEIVLSSHAEAEKTLDALYARLEEFGVVTVADLYDLVGITEDYPDLCWGWTDLRGSGIVMHRGGFLLRLPKTKPID